MKEKITHRLLYVIAFVCGLVGLASMVFLIIINSRQVTLNKGYSYDYSLENVELVSEYYIEADALFDEQYMSLSVFAGTEFNDTTVEYKIGRNSRLYIRDSEGAWKLIGKINAFELKLYINTSSSYILVLQCKSAKIANGFSIAFMVIGFTFAVAFTIVNFILNKKEQKLAEIISDETIQN